MPPAKGDFKGEIDAFCRRLRKGTTVGDFLKDFECVISRAQHAGLAGQYRLGKRGNGIDLKRLRDEVSSVARFTRKHAEPDDRISFCLDDRFSDCTLCHQDGVKRDIEDTLARGLARFHEMTELNECGATRGFLDLQDDASKADITAAKKQEPKVYSTDEAITNMLRAVEISAKGKLQHQGHTLLIEIVPDMNWLPRERWLGLPERLADNLTMKALRFSEVYVTSKSDEADLVLRIK